MTGSCPRISCKLRNNIWVEKCCRQILPILKDGGVWIAPTDTIYGISGNGLHRSVWVRIGRIKKRKNKLYILLVRDARTAEEYAVTNSIPAGLFPYFASGYVTLVLGSRISDFASTIALRVATDPLNKSLLERLEVPIISTSANLADDAYYDNPDEIYSRFGNKIDLMIDCGSLGNAEPSTIVDVTGNCPVLLRKGKMFEEVRQAIA